MAAGRQTHEAQASELIERRCKSIDFMAASVENWLIDGRGISQVERTALEGLRDSMATAKDSLVRLDGGHDIPTAERGQTSRY